MNSKHRLIRGGVVVLAALLAAAPAWAQTVISNYPPASAVSSTDKMLLQQGGPTTPYTYAILGQLAQIYLPLTGGTLSGSLSAPTLTATATGTAISAPNGNASIGGTLVVGTGAGFSLSTAGGINLGIGTAGSSPVTIQAANNNNIVLSTGGQVIVGGQYSPLVSGYYENTESTYTQSGTAPTPLLDLGGQFTGTFGSGGYAPYYALGTTSDTADASGMSQGAMVLFVNGNWGGSGFKGSRSGIYVQQTQQAATTDPSTAIAGISTNEFASYNMGGTGTGIGNGGGAIYGGVLKATAEGTATDLYRVLGAEVDFGMSGSSTASKQGALSLVLLSNSTNTAALQNSFLNLAAQPPAGATNTIPAIANGIAFGEYRWAMGVRHQQHLDRHHRAGRGEPRGCADLGDGRQLWR